MKVSILVDGNQMVNGNDLNEALKEYYGKHLSDFGGTIDEVVGGWEIEGGSKTVTADTIQQAVEEFYRFVNVEVKEII